MTQTTIDPEIKAEVFKIIRANQDRTPRQIIKLIKDHLPDVETEIIKKCIEDLIENDTNNN